MPDITFQCPSCQQEYTVDADLGGQIGSCEKCEAEFPIPTLEETIPPPVSVPVQDIPAPSSVAPRTVTMVADIITLVQEFTRSPGMPWEEQRRLLKQLDLCVVAFREQLESLEEQRKFDEQIKRQRG